MRSLMVLYSYHHHNTEKVAEMIVPVLGAEIKWPEDVNPEEIKEYDLIGFGSGIYGGIHHKTLLELADKLPETTDKKAFIFSTSAGVEKSKTIKSHSALREKLQSKGYIIVNEFQCRGFLGKIGLGISRGHPDAQDLKHAEVFAQNLIKAKD
ncbi:flavodoxin family protein [Methanobacterium formicicum]|uniref:Flavodoxin n=1 Tax=Methanobacterium formicicum (strain DSM 3637 / PP1) TaxID=1204725 RepID=K2RBI2_METFP|nr:flavodoxin family protein [Methanobacterium formicicum]EKF85669.1 flavodoxin [Methanobacterium formicicum DSM 3637]